MLKIDFENQILALFVVYFWPFNKPYYFCNHSFNLKCFIKFGCHDEKLIPGLWGIQVFFYSTEGFWDYKSVNLVFEEVSIPILISVQSFTWVCNLKLKSGMESMSFHSTWVDEKRPGIKRAREPWNEHGSFAMQWWLQCRR